MKVDLVATRVERADGTLSHTAVWLSEPGDYTGRGALVGHCPAGESLVLWINAKLAEYPGPGPGLNSFEIVRTEHRKLDA